MTKQIWRASRLFCVPSGSKADCDSPTRAESSALPDIAEHASHTRGHETTLWVFWPLLGADRGVWVSSARIGTDIPGLWGLGGRLIGGMRDSRIHRYECVRGYMWMSIWCGVADGCKPFRRGYPSCDIVGLCQGPFLSVGLVYASTL